MKPTEKPPFNDATVLSAQHPPRGPHTREFDSYQRAPNRFASFGYAFAGLGYLFRTQRNAQIHAAITLVVLLAGAVLGIGQTEWLALVVMIALVLAAEGINTAIEAVVDLASPQRHPLAKIAKDVAAGTVLLCAIFAVIVGMIVFLPRIWVLIAPWIGRS
jgi:diacylglycerol kinase (ATP)